MGFMDYFDSLLPVGRTNGAVFDAPTTIRQLLEYMDRYYITEALVVHTLSKDSGPDIGNMEILGYRHGRIKRVWGFDPCCVKVQTAAEFLNLALVNDIKAILVNPTMMGVRVDRTRRIDDLAGLLEERRIPLILSYSKLAGLPSDIINWCEVIDFCNKFPKLPVIAGELRTLSNRPMLEALAKTKNLKVMLSSIWQAQMLDTIVENFGHQKIVFSMGSPYMDPGDFQMVVNYADISPKAKIAVACGNMRSILKEANYEV
jgi:hypothetical protein